MNNCVLRSVVICPPAPSHSDASPSLSSNSLFYLYLLLSVRRLDVLNSNDIKCILAI